MFTKSCVLETDFDKYIHTSMVKTTDSITLTDGWAWNNNYKAAHFSDTQTGSLKASTEYTLGYFKAGDTIELNTEIMNVSGTKAKLTLDYSATSTFSSVTNIFTALSTKSGYFETVKAKAIAPYEGYYKASFGTFTTETSEYYIRNCVAKIETIVNVPSTDVQDLINENMKWFSARRDNQLSIVTSTNTQMTFETVNHAADFAAIDATTGQIKFLKTGVYQIFAYIAFAYNTTGYRLVTMSHVGDGRNAIPELPTGVNATALHEATTVNSLLDLSVRQTSGASLGVTGNIRIRKIGQI